MTNIEAIIENCRLAQPDHEGNNAWPSIRMETVTALCDEVERLQKQCEGLADALEMLLRSQLRGPTGNPSFDSVLRASNTLKNYRGEA